MENRFFTTDALKVLLRPERWKVIGSLFPPERKPVREQRYTRWARTHRQVHPEQVELIIALRGEVRYWVGGHVYPFRPGDVLFLDRGDEHMYPYPPRFPDCEHLLVTLAGDRILFRTYSVRRGREIPRKRPAESLGRPEMGSSFRLLLDEMRAGRGRLPASVTRAKLVGGLALLVAQMVEEGFSPAEPIGGEAMRKRVVDIVRDRIRETAGKGMSLQSLSRFTGYSKYHLLRIFKSRTGQTIHEYVDYCRMQKVSELLGEGYSKKHICYELGFSCPAAFSRWYRSRCGRE